VNLEAAQALPMIEEQVSPATMRWATISHFTLPRPGLSWWMAR
jgi:hypothetical protein